MKIAIVGNTNNYPYMLARGLRTIGHDAYLFVTSRELLHRPESGNKEFSSGYPAWIKDYSNIKEQDYYDLSPDVFRLICELETMNALILNSIGPSLLPLMKKKLPAISLLTGSDLTYYANPKLFHILTDILDPMFNYSAEGLRSQKKIKDLIARQSSGIRRSAKVSYFPKGIDHEGDMILKKIGIVNHRRMTVYMSGVDKINYTPPVINEKIRIFCATRFTWKLPFEESKNALDYKGSDIMIRGISLFYRKTGIPLDVHLVRKGLHVKETEDLIKEMGISEIVQWHDEMSLEEVHSQFVFADIVFEQMGESSYIGMAGLDAMATGRPVIGNFRPELAFVQFPICQARTPEEGSAHLERLASNPDERLKAGIVNRKFVEEFLSPEISARKCVQAFEDYQKRGLFRKIHDNLKDLIKTHVRY